MPAGGNLDSAQQNSLTEIAAGKTSFQVDEKLYCLRYEDRQSANAVQFGNPVRRVFVYADKSNTPVEQENALGILKRLKANDFLKTAIAVELNGGSFQTGPAGRLEAVFNHPTASKQRAYVPADFVGRNLSGKDFSFCTQLSGRSFRGARVWQHGKDRLRLLDANLSGCDFSGVDLTHALLYSKTWPLRWENIANVKLHGARLTTAQVEAINDVWGLSSEASETGLEQFPAPILDGAMRVDETKDARVVVEIIRCELPAAGEGSQLAKHAPVPLDGADMRGLQLDANCRQAFTALFVRAVRANFTGADLRHVDLRKKNLTGAILTKGNLKEADLTGAILCKVTADEVDMTKAQISWARMDDFQGKDILLTSVKADNTSFRRARLVVPGMIAAVIHNSCFDGAIIENPTIERQSFINNSVEDMQGPRELMAGTSRKTQITP